MSRDSVVGEGSGQMPTAGSGDVTNMSTESDDEFDFVQATLDSLPKDRKTYGGKQTNSKTSKEQTALKPSSSSKSKRTGDVMSPKPTAAPFLTPEQKQVKSKIANLELL